VKVAERPVLLDVEVVELLRSEPELLALADAVSSTQPAPPRRLRLRRLIPLAAALLVALVVVQLAPWRTEGGGLVDRALAAVGGGPVVHFVIETRTPGVTTVEIASGRAEPVTLRVEQWFDSERLLRHTVTYRNGLATSDVLERPGGGETSTGPVKVRPGFEPRLEPALDFVSGYREALRQGRATEVAGADVEGRSVRWLRFESNRVLELVAVDRETFKPLVIRRGDISGHAAEEWRVATIETVAHEAADLQPPRRQAPTPFAGQVLDRRPISVAAAAVALGGTAVTAGQSFSGLRLGSIQLETLSRTYPPGAAHVRTRSAGLRLAYGNLTPRGRADVQDGGVELTQSAEPEIAYGFGSGRTFTQNPVPPEGYLEATRFSTTWLCQLRASGLFVTVRTSTRELCLATARALRPTKAS
jgi:hypothetical protein